MPLDGVRFVFVAQSKAMMTQGEWIGGLIIDSAASDAQAEAVAAIASGAAGGPLGLFAPLITDFRGVERHPIAFVKDGKSVSVKIDGRLDQQVVGVDSVSVAGRVRRHRQYLPPREQAAEPGHGAAQRDQRVRHRMARRAGSQQRTLRTLRLAERGCVNVSTGSSARTLQRSLTFSALFAIGAIAWVFLVRSEAAMRTMAGDGPIVRLMRLMMRPAEPLSYFLAAAFMWVAMMIGMMTPAIVPMAIVFRGMNRATSRERDTLLFAGGYLLGWSLFGVAVAFVQLWLHARGLLVGDLLAMRTRGAGLVLLAAGLYQLTPFKEACLHHCRSPLGFFLEHWSPGAWGAVGMGLRHGLYCIGCCWVLMLLMFAGGAMSVLTMAALCGFILAERLLPPGPWVARLPGAVMILWGATLVVAG